MPEGGSKPVSQNGRLRNSQDSLRGRQGGGGRWRCRSSSPASCALGGSQCLCQDRLGCSKPGLGGLYGHRPGRRHHAGPGSLLDHVHPLPGQQNEFICPKEESLSGAVSRCVTTARGGLLSATQPSCSSPPSRLTFPTSLLSSHTRGLLFMNAKNRGKDPHLEIPNTKQTQRSSGLGQDHIVFGCASGRSKASQLQIEYSFIRHMFLNTDQALGSGSPLGAYSLLGSTSSTF